MTEKQKPVDIVKVEEPWATATLPDGSRVRVKLVFTACYRTLDAEGNPEFAPDGKPNYGTTFNWIIDVQAPASAMKKEPTK